MSITYQRDNLTAEQFADVLNRSGLGNRRPVDDLPRLRRILSGTDLLLTARDRRSGSIVGVARSLTDWAYACYLADLAVDRAFQGQGIGRRLIELTREHVGEESLCLLISAPEAIGFYEKVGMPQTDRAFMYPRAS